MYTDSSFKVNSKQSCSVWLSKIAKIAQTVNPIVDVLLEYLAKHKTQQCGKLQVEVLLKLFEPDSEDLAHGNKFLTFMTLAAVDARLLISVFTRPSLRKERSLTTVYKLLYFDIYII